MKRVYFLSARPLLAAAMCLLATGCEVLGDGGTGPEPAAVQCDGTGRVTVDGEVVPAAPSGFVAVGTSLLNASTCDEMRFVGVSRPPLSYSPDGGRLGMDTAAARDFANMRAWGANTVRLELAQYYWVPTARYHAPSYPARVERVVRQAREAGLNVILALQVSDRGIADYDVESESNTQQPMPDRNHSIPFWRDVATRFKNDGGVLFELYSEPHPVGGRGGFSNWSMWRNGGTHPADNTYTPRPAFEAVGMQELYEVVRSTGAHNLVIIGGTKWGYYLDGVPQNRIQGYNIAYAAHPWHHPEWPGNEPGAWEQDWAFLARTDPVIVTEFGSRGCDESYVRALLDKADQLEIGWVAWMWNAPTPGQSTRQESVADPICDRSLLLMDWDATPTRMGTVVKQRLQSY